MSKVKNKGARIKPADYIEYEGLKLVTEAMVKKVHGKKIAALYDQATTQYMTTIVRGERCMIASEYEKWANRFDPPA